MLGHPSYMKTTSVFMWKLESDCLSWCHMSNDTMTSIFVFTHDKLWYGLVWDVTVLVCMVLYNPWHFCFHVLDLLVIGENGNTFFLTAPSAALV